MFGISIPIVQVAGGLIVVHAGWRLLNAEDPDSGHHEKLADDFNIEKAKANSFYPLTFRTNRRSRFNCSSYHCRGFFTQWCC
ncbi:hypothetical protein OURE66S_00955 [Oligella ureolytica]